MKVWMSLYRNSVSELIARVRFEIQSSLETVEKVSGTLNANQNVADSVPPESSKHFFQHFVWRSKTCGFSLQ